MILELQQHQFEGPLDLLLSLIEQQKLDITQVAIAQVTEQFLQYVKRLEVLDPTVIADYLSIAAKLLVIKSKTILPTLVVPTEEEDPGENLEERLIQYKYFKEASKWLKERDNLRLQGFGRLVTFEQKIHFFPDPDVTPDLLHEKIIKVVEELKELEQIPKAKIREVISIQEKIDSLQHDLANKIQTSLSELISNAKDKNEVIITFLALLELIKQRIFTVEQETLFADVTIKKYEKEVASN